MSRPIRFLLDGEIHEVDDQSPERTVLQYLRENLGRTGTKEGCAEGDCGACTVVLAELTPDHSDVRIQAINACIRFLPTIDGKALVSVESLSPPAGPLHPVQQAMVDHHGSQCGFCTPGFVMSMVALYLNEPTPDREAIDVALSGNLCRCTGYRPIIDAARDMAQYPVREPNAHSPWLDDAYSASPSAESRARRDALHQQLLGLQGEAALVTGDAKTQCFAPRSLAELDALLAEHPEATLLAGGTDVGLWVTKLYRDLGTQIYLGEIPELKTIENGAQTLDVGAMVSFSDALPVLCEAYPDLQELLLRFASPPIRNSATIGGNVANGSPIGDSMPALIALGASVELYRSGVRRSLPLEELYLDYQKNALQPGEIVERIQIPKADDTLVFRAYKNSKRFDQDISAVCAAFAIKLENGKVTRARCGFGGVAAVPARANTTEKALIGQPWNQTTIDKAMVILSQEFSPLDDMRASSRYRSDVCANLLQRFFIETTESGTAARLYG